MVLAYWLIGRKIVLELQGKNMAKISTPVGGDFGIAIPDRFG